MKSNWTNIIILLLLFSIVAGGVIFYSRTNESTEKIDAYKRDLSEKERALEMKKREVERLKEEYNRDLKKLNDEASDQKKEIIALKKKHSLLKKYYLSLSNEESIKELEQNLDTTLNVDTINEIVFLPTLKTKEINYTYSKEKNLNIIVEKQDSLIKIQDSIYIRQMIYIDTLENNMDFYSNQSDSLLTFAKIMIEEYEDSEKENAKLRKQRKMLIWIAALEAVGLVILKIFL